MRTYKHIDNFKQEAEKDFDKAYALMMHDINESFHRMYCMIAIHEIQKSSLEDLRRK